jgi:hypothetical protein
MSDSILLNKELDVCKEESIVEYLNVALDLFMFGVEIVYGITDGFFSRSDSEEITRLTKETMGRIEKQNE